MSWFNPQALQSIANKVQEYAENALVIEEEEQEQGQMEGHPLSNTPESIIQLQEQNSALKAEVWKACPNRQIQSLKQQQQDTNLLQEKLGRAVEYIKELSQENAMLTERLEREPSLVNTTQESELEELHNKIALLTQQLESNNERERKLQENVERLTLKLDKDSQTPIPHTSTAHRATDCTFALTVLDALFSESISSLDIPQDQRQHFLDFQNKFKECVSGGKHAFTPSDSEHEHFDQSLQVETQDSVKLSLLNEDLVKENGELREKHIQSQEQIASLRTMMSSKLQMELDKKSSIENELAVLKISESELKEQNSDLVAQLESLRKRNASSSLESARVHVELEASREANERLMNEIERLRIHLVETEDAHGKEILGLDDVIASLKMEISEISRGHSSVEDAIQAGRDAMLDLEAALKEANEELVALKADNDILRQKAEEDAKCIRDLQGVLEEFEHVKNSEIELSLRETRKTIDAQSFKIIELEQQIQDHASRLGKLGFSPDQLESELLLKNELIKKLKHDVAQLQSHLSEAMKRLKDGVNDDRVDRHLVTNLLVQFLSYPMGDPRKFEILGVIAGILRLSEEDRVRIGLARGNRNISSLGQPSQENSFTDMWIAFLFKEAGALTSTEAPLETD